MAAGRRAADAARSDWAGTTLAHSMCLGCAARSTRRPTASCWPPGGARVRRAVGTTHQAARRALKESSQRGQDARQTQRGQWGASNEAPADQRAVSAFSRGALRRRRRSCPQLSTMVCCVPAMRLIAQRACYLLYSTRIERKSTGLHPVVRVAVELFFLRRICCSSSAGGRCLARSPRI